MCAVLASFSTHPGTILAGIVVLILCGSLVYSLLQIIAAWRYLAVKAPPLRTRSRSAFSSLLPDLISTSNRIYGHFLSRTIRRSKFCLPSGMKTIRAAQVVARLQREYPRLLAAADHGEPPYPNAKVYSLDRMLAAAANDLVVMSDSDIRVTPDLLRTVAAEFQDAHLGVATCPYRAVPGPSFWSRLEATGMNTDFWGSALVARMLEGMHFAVGPTIAARRRVLQSIGGFERVKDYLAEDFVLGKFAAEAGHGVILSSYVIEHHIGSCHAEAEYRAPPALDSQHAAFASGRIRRAVVHDAFAARVTGVRALAGVVAGFAGCRWSCAPWRLTRFQCEFCTQESTGSCCRWKI